MYRSALKQDLRFGEAFYRLGLIDLKLAAYGDAAQMLLRAASLQPDNQDAATKLAELYLIVALRDPQHSADMLKNAKDLADHLVTKDPRSFEGHRLLGQIDLIEKDIPAALKELAAAKEAHLLQPDAVLSYVQALVANNRFPAAEKLAYELIGKEKAYSPIYDLLYLYYVKQNRLDDGERLLKLKTESDPQNASYLIQLAAHYYLSRRRADMDAVIQKLSNEKEFPEGRLLAGDFFLFRLREFGRAEEQYDAAIKAFPKDKAFYQKRLVDLYASANRGPEANGLLATILKENPKDVDAIAMRAALSLSTGDAQQINGAANDLQCLVNKTPTNYLLRFNLARALVAKRDFDQARVQLEEAIRLRPDFIAARELLARVQVSHGDSSGALKAADDLIARDPGNLQAHLVKSSGLLGLGQNDRAKDELSLISKAYPQNVEARFQVGYLAWKQKDFKRSEEIFTELHKSDPKDLRGLVGFVETMAAENRIGQAIEETNKILEQNPDRGDVRLVLANLLVRDHPYDRAIQNFQILLQKDPNASPFLLRLGETYRMRGDLNAAIEAFRRASKAAPGDSTPLLQLGLLMDATGRIDQAEPVYEQILKIRPDHAVALNNLAFIKAERGIDLDQALTMAQRALQQQPGSSDFADTLGWIYIKKNLSDNVVRIFSDLVAKQPANALYHYHFGLALLEKGDRSSARRELEAAIKNPPAGRKSQDTGRASKIVVGTPPKNLTRSPSLLFIAPFASLIAVLAVQRAFVLPPLLMEGGSVAIVAAVIALSWRRTPDLQPGKFGLRYGFGSLIVGAAAFLLWIAPDVLIPGYRHHPWFENPLFGKFVPGLSEAARAQPAVLWLRALRAIVLAPASEESFWRAWLMRRLVRDKFLELPRGTYSPFSFWRVALLFGMEHGPQWDVGIATGILYNWWMVRAKSLGV